MWCSESAATTASNDSRLLHVLELEPAEVLARGRERVDPEHVVARDGQRRRQLALAAADLEHARRRRRQVLADELEERRLRHDAGRVR